MRGILQRLRKTSSGRRAARGRRRGASGRERRLTFETMEERVVLSAAGSLQPASDSSSDAEGSVAFLQQWGIIESLEDGALTFDTATSTEPTDQLGTDIRRIPKTSADDFINLGQILIQNGARAFQVIGEYGSDRNGDLLLSRGEFDEAFPIALPFGPIADEASGFGLIEMPPFRTEDPDDAGGPIYLDLVPKPKLPDPEPPPNESSRITMSALSDMPEVTQGSAASNESPDNAPEITPSRGRALAIEVALSVDATYDDPAITGSSSDGVRANGPRNAAEFDSAPITPGGANDARPSGSDNLRTGRAAAWAPSHSETLARPAPLAREATVGRAPAGARAAAAENRVSTTVSWLEDADSVLSEAVAGPEASSMGGTQGIAPTESAHDAAFAAWDESAGDISLPASLPLWLRNHAREPLVLALLVAASAGQVVYAPGPAKRHKTEQLPPCRRR